MTRPALGARAASAGAEPRLVVRVARTAAVLIALVGGVSVYVTQPLGCIRSHAPARRVDPVRLAEHVRTLAETMAPRDADHPENLARAAEYVRAQLALRLGEAELQPFTADGRSAHNVRAFAGPKGGARIVVGAHYDAADPGIGADDNASGVAGLIELAGLLAGAELRTRVELVAFALEEPPYFRTRSMGSFVHAQALRSEGVPVVAMLCLEMIGCFRDEPGSQSYPVPGLAWLYPSAGNFVAIVGCMGGAGLVRRVKGAFAEASSVPVRSINAPRFVPGVDFSDHLEYWDAGFDAVMITDTAFYRNPRYHEASDVPATLDYPRMAAVVEGVYAAVRSLAAD
jgi:hypothetical protein